MILLVRVVACGCVFPFLIVVIQALGKMMYTCFEYQDFFLDLSSGFSLARPMVFFFLHIREIFHINLGVFLRCLSCVC